MGINNMITLAVGTPSDIVHFVLFGLGVQYCSGFAYTDIVAF